MNTPQQTFSPIPEYLKLTVEEERQEQNWLQDNPYMAQAKHGQPFPPGAPEYLKDAIFLVHPFVWAGRGEIWRTKRALIDGADVNEGDDRGLTPLHHAVYSGDPAIVRLLMQCGADPSHKAPSGETPVDLARRMNAEAMIDIMDVGAQGANGRINNISTNDISQEQLTESAKRACQQASCEDASFNDTLQIMRMVVTSIWKQRNQ